MAQTLPATNISEDPADFRWVCYLAEKGYLVDYEEWIDVLLEIAYCSVDEDIVDLTHLGINWVIDVRMFTQRNTQTNTIRPIYRIRSPRALTAAC